MIEIPIWRYTSSEYRDGDKVTIQGIRRRKDGTYTKRCKPGNETVFTIRVNEFGKPILVSTREKK